MDPRTQTEQELRLPAPLQIGSLRLSVPYDLEINKCDDTFIITKSGAQKICNLIRKENGRDSAKVLCEFLDIVLHENFFSTDNFQPRRFGIILTPINLFDLPDSYSDKLIALLSSEDKGKAKKAALILRSSVYGIAHKDPAIFLSTIILTGIKPPNLSYFSELLKRHFKKQPTTEELDARRDTLLEDVDNIFSTLGNDLKNDSANRDRFRNEIKTRADERKNKIINPNIQITLKKITPLKTPPKRVTSTKTRDSNKAQVVATPTIQPNLSRVIAAVKRFQPGQVPSEAEPIEVISRPSIRNGGKSSQSGQTEISIRLNNLVTDPTKWENLDPAEVIQIAVNFSKKLADKGSLSRELVAEIAIHIKKIADALQGKDRDLEIAEALLHKNFESHNLLAVLYLIELNEPLRISQTICALELAGYDKFQLKNRFSENLFKSALQIRAVSQSEAKKSAVNAVDKIIQLLRLPFDSDELFSDG